MVLTNSTMLPLGTKAPAFTLPEVQSNKDISLSSFEGKKGLLVMFICNHCPYVKHIRTELAKLGNEYTGKNIGVIAISSNDKDNYPEDSPAKMAQEAKALNYGFPYCHDDSQEIARAYSAACTPDFFLFDKDFKLVYRGQFDESRPGNAEPVTGKDLRAALDAVLAGTEPKGPQKASVGCNIKWKSGKEPF
jgi:peroxiredoxin